MGSTQQEVRLRQRHGATRRLGRRVRRAAAAPYAVLARARGPLGRPPSPALPFDDATAAGLVRGLPRPPRRPRSERTALDVVADGATTTADVVRRLWDAQSRSPLGGAASTSLRVAWVVVVTLATCAVLGFGLPRSLSGLTVVIVGIGLVIRPALLLCLGDDTLFTPDQPTRAATGASSPSRRADADT